MRCTQLALALAALSLAACSGGGSGGGSGTLILDATDDAFVYDIVSAATVSVDEVSIHKDAAAESGFLVLYEGPPMLLDLFHLRDGLTQTLAQANLPVGSYRQLRLHVTDARLELVNGNVYSTADGNLRLTSQDTSGFKVLVDPPIVISRGETTPILLDFDLTKTFHPIPASDPLAATSYGLHPVIHAANVSDSGGIHGLVTQPDGSGGTMPAADATVYVPPPGGTDPSQSVATTGTSASGTYTVQGLVPGFYDVLAVKQSLHGRVDGVAVVAGAVTEVDVEIQ